MIALVKQSRQSLRAVAVNLAPSRYQFGKYDSLWP